MGNLKILPEHIQLLNGIIPHLGKKDKELADRTLSVLKLLSGQAGEGKMVPMVKLMASACSQSNNDVLQAVGKLVKNVNSRSQQGNSSDFDSTFLLFLILILLVQK